MSILLYADDILLIAPSVTSLQQLLNICEQELECLDRSLNAKTSTCIRIGLRFNANCSNIVETGVNLLGLMLYVILGFL